MSINTSFSHDYVLDKIKDIKVGIITSQWNDDITLLLKNSCNNFLINAGLKKNNINNYYVPGSMELVLASDILLNKKKIDGVIALGCIIKGETNHDKYISQSVCRGLLDVSLKHNLPVIFGVLTTNSKKQAVERAGGKCGNKGEDAAYTFLKMIEYQNNLNS